MAMMKFQLDDDERRVLQMLARGGAMSPSEVSAKTSILPGDTQEILRKFTDIGLVLMRTDVDSADGMLVVLTTEARDFLGTTKA